MDKLLIEICIGTSCHLLGSQDLIDAIEELTDEVKDKIDLQGVTCLKSCGKGPNVRINGIVIPNVTPEQLIEIVNDKLLMLK